MGAEALFRNTVKWVVVASVLNAIGSVLHLYNSVWWYSWFVHICAGVGLGFFWMYLMKRFDWVYNLSYAVLATFAVAVLWEVLEFVLRVTRYDTLFAKVDNLMDVVFAVLATVAVYWFVLIKDAKQEDKRQGDI